MGRAARHRFHAQKKTLYAKERESERVKAQRAAFFAKQPTLNVRRLIFLDESGMRLGTPPRYGWARCGQKSIGQSIQGHWKSMTLIGAIGLTGFKGFATFDTATTGDVFLAFVRSELCPHLQPGDCVVMDNLAAHKVAGVREAIEARGAQVLHLPPYSPELNPIEKLWAKLKEFVRRCQNNTRDLFDLAVAKAMDAITTSDLEGWFRHCGYSLTET